MKKLLLALALMLPMVVFTACEKDKENEPGNNNESGLVGTWIEDRYQSFCMQFNADHSGCEWEVEDGEADYKWFFTWSTNGNTLTFVYHEDGDVYNSQYSINNDQLIVDGYTYRRVK